MKSLLPADSELIPRLLKKDQTAYFAVVKAYQGILIQVARSIIGDSLADEVVQEAWLAAFKALPRFEGRSTLKTWLIKIVSNSAKTRLRKESRTISFSELSTDSESIIDPSRFSNNGHWNQPPGIWDVDTPEALLSSEQLKSCLDKAISALPPPQRAVLTLRDMQDQDMETICKVLEISESNARVLLHRARSNVREAIDRCQRK